MNAAVVHSFDTPPQFGTFADPVPEAGTQIITVIAAALNPLVRAQAAGKHYSSETRFPFVPGVDGVGRLADGSRVYFAFPQAPNGAMAERTAVREKLIVPVPEDLDDITAAALANPGMSSWAALTARAGLMPGETVLVNGATGSAGRLAVQIAKHLGAGRVVAAGRNQARLDALRALGADVTISLEQSDETLRQRFREEVGAGVDVVLDYLWGRSAEVFLSSLTGSGSGEAAPRLRYVQIGGASSPAISLPASVLRSSGLELLGSGLGSVSHVQLIAAIGMMLQAAVPAGLTVDTEAVPLSDVEDAWTRDTGEKRLVFTVG